MLTSRRIISSQGFQRNSANNFTCRPDTSSPGCVCAAAGVRVKKKKSPDKFSAVFDGFDMA